jgi:hypothetical protein
LAAVVVPGLAGVVESLKKKETNYHLEIKTSIFLFPTPAAAFFLDFV